jgi:hypothetical protein
MKRKLRYGLKVEFDVDSTCWFTQLMNPVDVNTTISALEFASVRNVPT